MICLWAFFLCFCIFCCMSLAREYMVIMYNKNVSHHFFFSYPFLFLLWVLSTHILSSLDVFSQLTGTSLPFSGPFFPLLFIGSWSPVLLLWCLLIPARMSFTSVINIFNTRLWLFITFSMFPWMHFSSHCVLAFCFFASLDWLAARHGEAYFLVAG